MAPNALAPYQAFLGNRPGGQQPQQRHAAQDPRRAQPAQFRQFDNERQQAAAQPWAATPYRGDPRFAARDLGPDAQPRRGTPALPPQQQQRGASLRQQDNEWQSAPAVQRAQMRRGSMETDALSRFGSYQDETEYDQDGQFSPQAYGGSQWRDGLQRHVPDPRNRIFNREGTLNADNKKDALQQIKHLMQGLRNGGIRPARYRRTASPEEMAERRQVLAAAMQDQEGFRILGQELLLPIKEIVDYEGFIRRVFRVRPLQQGEFFRMAKDVRSTAWVIGVDGQGVEARLQGKYVTPDEFKIGSFPTVEIEDIYLMNFDVLDRAQDTARQEIELEEDKRGIVMLDTIASALNTVTGLTTLGLAAFEDVRYQVERHRLVVEHFLINRAELSDIVKTMSASVDPVTERELILAGYIGTILNATIMTSAGTGVEEVVPAGTIYACVGPDYLGEMGVRIELFAEPFNMFSQFRFVKGWAMGEMIGFVAPSARGVAKGVK